jgi:hypothetical protein
MSTASSAVERFSPYQLERPVRTASPLPIARRARPHWQSLEITNKTIRELSNAELLAIAAGSGEENPAPPKPKKDFH